MSIIILNEGLLFATLLLLLLGVAFAIHQIMVMEHRLFSVEKRLLESDEQLEASLRKIAKAEQHIERMLYRHR